MKKQVITKEECKVYSEFVTQGVEMAEKLEAIIKEKGIHAGLIVLVGEDIDKKVAASLALGGCDCILKGLLTSLYEENPLAKSIMREILVKDLASGMFNSSNDTKKQDNGKQESATAAS